MSRRYDVLMVSDLRLPGGTSASIAEEIRAQARAGLRTGLLHVDSPLVRKKLGFNPRITAAIEDGDAEVVLGSDPVETDLLVMRHPTVLGVLDPATAPPVACNAAVMVANQAPGTPDGQAVHYEPHAVDAHVRAWTGDVPLTWAPIGPLVRENLQLIAPDLELVPDDWVNVIDVDAWATDRSDGVVGDPVIGRHSRNSPYKWPADPTELRAAYPERDDLEVHVLGGAQDAIRVLGGKQPHNWHVYEFGTLDPGRFLGATDFFVYFHHPELVEAFGRTTLEALASGAVAILPPHFEILFEDAALYTDAAGVEPLIRELSADRDAYVARSEHGRAFVRERYSYDTHIGRLYALLDRPAPAATPAAPVTARPRVLFVSSNGAGVGHLMRLMSMARRSETIDPLFLTLSQALGVVHDLGFLVEYVASRPYTGAPSQPWHAMLRSRLVDLVDAHGVKAVVFDGTWPYQGLLELPDERPDVKLVWSRRAMWRAGVTSPVLAEAGTFDLIIEPGEFAADADTGITTKLRRQALQIPPISFLSREEQLDRAEARAQLDLDPDRPAALVQLGAGNINDTTSLLETVVTRLAKEPDLQVCVTRSAIAERVADVSADVRTISVYPLARYLRAFDLAVAASGYNTFHELVATPVPTLFVPNLQTATDDQAARARFAEHVGVGTCLTEVTDDDLERALEPLLDPDTRRRMIERAEARITGNGGPDAMRAIERLLAGETAGPDPSRVQLPDLPELRAAVAASTPPTATPPSSPTAAPPAATATTGSAAPPASGTADPATTPGAASSPTTGAPGEGAPPPTGLTAVRMQARRRLAKAKGALAVAAEKPEVRAAVGEAFRKLPVETQRKVRRRLRRWDRRKFKPRNTRDAPLPVPPGTVLPEDERAGLTPILIVLPEDLPGDQVRAVVDQVAGLQLARRTFTPLFVTGTTDTGTFRRYGYLFEYLPAAATWATLAAPERREGYVRARMRDILGRYRIARVVTIDDVTDVRDRLVPLLT